MRLMHLSDLHLGKRLHELSLLEDQRYILDQITELVKQEQPDAVLICGDIYDKAVPPAEAVLLFDHFLQKLTEQKKEVLIISGNHDSAERLHFGSGLMCRSGVWITSLYDGNVEKVCLEDAYGAVNFYLLPFLKPALVRHALPDTDPSGYQEAVQLVLERFSLNTAERNVLLAHQFVTGAHRSESEEISVGGLDQIDAALFSEFDYVALGHIHTPQKIERETMRYCGTPLKYSFSEAGQEKSVTIVDLECKGTVSVRTIPLHPLRDLQEIRGSYEELTARSFYGERSCTDYLWIHLTDREEIVDAVHKLRSIYPNLLRLDYVREGQQSEEWQPADAAAEQSPMELFAEFYRQQNGEKLQEKQKQYLEILIKEIWEEQG